MNLNKHEPIPVRADHPAVWPEVILDMDVVKHVYAEAGSVVQDMADRHQFGIEKHGGPLVVDDVRRSLVDLYQEMLDASVYTKKALMEHMLDLGDRMTLTEIYCNMLEQICEVRRLIERYHGGEL